MLSIRLASFDDLTLLPPIEKQAATLYPIGRIPHPKETLPEKVLLDALKEELLFCAEDHGKLAGFASCHLYGNYLHLDEISVHPDSGRKGLGRALVERVIKETQKRKLKGCTLTTFEDLSWNAPFYKKSGFCIMEKENIPRHVAAMLRDEKSIGLKNRVAMIYKC